MKKLVDKTLAMFGLVLSAPIMLGVFLAIRMTSPGRAIFAQRRVGKNQEVFTCYKFRTMVLGTKEAGTHEVAASSVTPLGQFLRKTKLDELPQLYNVVRGEMSLVGPRPCLPVQEELIRERAQRGVYQLVPGITGLGQVRGIDMSDPVILAECDAEYLANRSFWYDIRLVWRTLLGGGQGDRISRE